MWLSLLVLLLCSLLSGSQQEHQQPETPDWKMTLKRIRNGVHKIDMYLNAALDLLGGEDGLCRFKCRDGFKPSPRYGYKPSPPNGCGSPVFGFHFDVGIPSMTKCCNQHDRCYDTCGNLKNECDEQFQACLSKICRDVQRTLGIAETVKGEMEVDSRALENKDRGVNLTRFETDSWLSKSKALDPAAEYNMKHGRRGLALIFNHEFFNYKLRLNIRNGTNVDQLNLEKSLTQLGFEVKHYYGLEEAKVHEKIQEAARSDHSNADCFLCVFLSHGEDGHIFAYDNKIEIKELTRPFKGDMCPSLAGKPKIFIFQACRGTEHDEPVLVADCTDGAVQEPEVNKVEVDAAAVYTLPAGADFIMCYSVAEGYFSHRDRINGSWYIWDLCEAIRMYGSELEFTELLTLVNRKVSLRSIEASFDFNEIGKKQVPCFASMLTKKLYLRPKQN